MFYNREDVLEIGQEERVLINITIIAHRDPAFRVRMKGIIPFEVEYERVVTYPGGKTDAWCMFKNLNTPNEIGSTRSSAIEKTATKEEWHTVNQNEDELYCYISDYIPFASKVKYFLT